MFINAVRLVTVDKGFQIATERAQKALLTADRLLQAIEVDDRDQKATRDFASVLLKRVRSCCSHPRAVTCHTFKEKMWEKFYKLCADEDFHTQWKLFIQASIGFNGTPIFYQFVTRAIFEEIIKIQLPTQTDCRSTHSSTPLDLKESNALRYCGGYIVRSLKKKIKKSACLFKDELLHCLQELTEGKQWYSSMLFIFKSSFFCSDDDSDDDAEPDSDSEKWLKAINRGGLIFITDSMFQFLVAVELELRNHFTTSVITYENLDENIKEIAVLNVLRNEDVKFYWDMISFNWVSNEAQELLRMIVEHYITIRGFSFARAFMEKYKQALQKTTQKSKGLRKTL